MPELSIVTITWNDVDGLRATIDSLAMQAGLELLDYEIVVVDNLSNDGTYEYVMSLAGFPIRYIREKDSGIYDALNKGTRLAGAAHILYLNAGDCLRDSQSLWSMMELTRRYPNAPAVVSGAVQRDADGRERMLRNVPHSWFKHAYGLRSHCHAAMIFNAHAVKSAGGYSLDAEFAGDFDLILRLGLLGPLPSQPRVCVTYDGTGLSAQRKREIPLLLHRIRAGRLQYPSWAASLDRAFVSVVEGYRSVRRWLRFS